MTLSGESATFTPPAAGATRRRRFGGMRWRRFTGRAVLATALALLAYNLAAEVLVFVSDFRAERNSQSRILVGAEERDIGRPDSSNVAIFVHGCVGAGNNFNRLPDLLADQGWRVRVMRLPGHGVSPRDFQRTTVDELREAVDREATAARAGGARRVLLVGHSMGAALATLTASHVSVDGLILGGAYFGVQHQWYYLLRPETWHRMLSPLIRWVYKGKLFLQCNRPDAKSKIVSFSWAPSKGLGRLIEIGALAKRPETLRRIVCPVLMLHGPGDVAASYDAAKSAFDQMASRHKDFVSLPRSNHHVFWDWEADIAEERCLRFAAELTRKSNSEGSKITENSAECDAKR